MKTYFTLLSLLSLLMMSILNSNLIHSQTNDRSNNSATPSSTDPVIIKETNVNLDQKDFHDFPENTGSQLNITIIESQSQNTGHVMDMVWEDLAGNLGHTPTILPQTSLDDNSFFASTDILIVSSGVITLPSNRVNTILEFIRSGGPVYLQNEYQCSYTSNLAFQAIVDSLNGIFSMTGTVSGDLIPMNVFGTLSGNPNQVDTLGYFWYGCAGVGDSITVIPFLEYSSQYFGFILTPPNPVFGTVITTSDQDWVRLAASSPDALALMENILAYLSGASVGIDEPLLRIPGECILFQNFPNPFNPSTTIGYQILKPGDVELKIFDALGQEIGSLINQWQDIGSYQVVWGGTDQSGNAMPSGAYFYRLKINDFTATHQMMLLK